MNTPALTSLHFLSSGSAFNSVRIVAFLILFPFVYLLILLRNFIFDVPRLCCFSFVNVHVLLPYTIRGKGKLSYNCTCVTNLSLFIDADVSIRHTTWYLIILLAISLLYSYVTLQTRKWKWETLLQGLVTKNNFCRIATPPPKWVIAFVFLLISFHHTLIVFYLNGISIAGNFQLMQLVPDYPRITHK